MASDDHEYVFLNKEDGEAEDASYIKTIMDLPEVEISEDVQIEDEHDDEDLTRKEPEEPWEESKVKQLLGLYLQNFDKFQNPKIRKSTLWRKIGLAVGRDGDSCDRKYRNIKQHYCTIRKKKGYGKMIRWPYYDLLEEIRLKGGVHSNETQFKKVKYRPIMAKTQPQVLVVSNPSNFQSVQLANLNTAIPMNNGLGTLNVTDTPAQKRRKMEEFHSISGELKERQKNIDKKLERLIEVVEESNKIQKDRNRLLQEYLSKIN